MLVKIMVKIMVKTSISWKTHKLSQNKSPRLFTHAHSELLHIFSIQQSLK